MATAISTTTTVPTAARHMLFQVEDGIAVSLRLLELAHLAATAVATASPEDTVADAVTQQLCMVMDLLGEKARLMARARQQFAHAA